MRLSEDFCVKVHEYILLYSHSSLYFKRILSAMSMGLSSKEPQLYDHRQLLSSS